MTIELTMKNGISFVPVKKIVASAKDIKVVRK